MNTARAGQVFETSSEAAHGLIGQSQAMRELRARLEKVALSDSPILIQGETGTGKDVVARAAHRISSRASKRFVVVDCGCFTPSLLESELFGHARGAFTGAHEARAGAIESANFGTVFLDEVGEIPLDLQSRLLRVLESRTIRRVGETAHRQVDVRFVFATHRDLRTMVANGRFREDLYFRIAVLSLRVPPLRERLDDIPLLAAHFRGPDAAPLDAAALKVFEGRQWPGNVRELRNLLARVSALGAEGAISQPPPRMDVPPASAVVPRFPPPPSFGSTLLPPQSPAPPAPRAPGLSPGDFDFNVVARVFRETWMEFGERMYISRLLARANDDIGVAAELAGVNKTYVYRLLRKYRSLERHARRS